MFIKNPKKTEEQIKNKKNEIETQKIICEDTKRFINNKPVTESANFCDNVLIRIDNKTCKNEIGKTPGTDVECSCKMFLEKFREFVIMIGSINMDQNKELYDKAEIALKILENEIPNQPISWNKKETVNWSKRQRRGALAYVQNTQP